MRQFSADYLRRTRSGMWESRAALADLELPTRERTLDVGCGTGELTRVLDTETPGEVVGLDADPSLLDVAREGTDLPLVAGDATRLPFSADAFDLVVCQALLVNLPDPAAAVSEFGRVSSDLVAAVEPNNAEVGVSSTVESEERLERRVRRAFLDGLDTDAALGARVATLFEDADFRRVRTRRYFHRRVVEPPYSDADLEGATKKANGAVLLRHETELRRALSDAAYDDLREAWREMGREVVRQMGDREYRRVEVVPFEVTAGRV